MGNNISRQRHRNIQASRSSWTHHEDSQQRGEATCDESSVPENGQYVTHADHEDEERPSRLRRLSRSLVSKRSSGHWAPARGPSLHRSEESARYRRQKRQSFFKRQSSPPKNSAAGDIKHPTSAGSHQTGTLACVSDDYSTTETESIARAGQQSSQTIGHNTPLPLGTSSR